MSDIIREITVPAEAERLEEVQAFVGRFLEENDCPVKAQMAIEVSVEEIFVNIASYAYAPEKGEAVIKARIIGQPAEIEITFSDSGKPFDPLKKEDPDVTLSAEERSIGGLGIFLTKKMMDAVSYERSEGRNILRIKKSL